MKNFIMDLEYDCAMNTACRITEAAIRHGLDPKIKQKFIDYVGECIEDYYTHMLLIDQYLRLQKIGRKHGR